MASGPDLFVVCKKLRLRGVPVHHGVPVLRHAAAQARAEARERRRAEARRSAPRERPQLGAPAAGRDPGHPRRPAARTRRSCSSSRRSSSTLVLDAGRARRSTTSRCGAGVDDEYWRSSRTLFVYGARPATRSSRSAPIFLFGWLLERRHGPWAPLLVFFVGGAAGIGARRRGRRRAASRSAATAPRWRCSRAWAMRDLLGRRRGDEDDARPARRAGDRRRARAAAAGRADGRARWPGSAAA